MYLLWKKNPKLYLKIRYRLFNSNYWLKKTKWVRKLSIKKGFMGLLKYLFDFLIIGTLAGLLTFCVVSVMHYNRSLFLTILRIFEKYREVFPTCVILISFIFYFILMKEMIFGIESNGKRVWRVVKLTVISFILVFLAANSLKLSLMYVKSKQSNLGQQSIYFFVIFILTTIYYIKYIGAILIRAFISSVQDSKDRITIVVSVCTVIVAVVSLFK